MTESEIKRVVVACDAQGEIEQALREAAALAAHWRVPLHGVFLKDENLLRLAGLPFARALNLASREAESLASGDLEALLSALAARMCRALAAAAEEAGLEWSFAELRDVPSAALKVVEEGDMLVIEAGAPPVSGSWRLRSPWEAAAAALGGSVLLRRAAPAARPRRTVLVLRAGADHERILRAARSVKGSQDEAFILYSRADAPARELAQQLAAHGFAAAKPQAVKDWADLRRRIERLKPDLVVLGTDALAEDELRGLIAETSCDLLLLG
jgi:nucleotide-binding universal stress UspA family protein